MKKRYLLFVGSRFYPLGGANDFIGSFDSVDEAINYFDPKNYKWSEYGAEEDLWANIFDLEIEKIVKTFDHEIWGDSEDLQL